MNSAAAKPTRRLGNYVLGRRIGAGGMAAVFAARQEGPAGLGRLCALKVMSTALLGDPSYERMFLREAGISARLEHRNAVRVYEVGEADGTLFIAMELVYGVTLRELSAAGPLPLPIAVRMVEDVCRALHAAHELKDERGEPFSLVHQDVTPHNVMLTYDGVTKLLDFGVARIGASDASRTDTIRGKPAYLSPEQIAGRNIDRRTDVFAMAILLYELCTGRRLFERPTTLEIYLAITEGHIEDVKDSELLPAPIAALCARALSLDRQARHPDARSFGVQLAAARRELSLDEPDEDELGAWVNRCKPPGISLTQLEREIVEGRHDEQRSLTLATDGIADLPTEAVGAPAAGHDSGVRSRSADHAADALVRLPERASELPSVPLERAPRRILIALAVALGGAGAIVWTLRRAPEPSVVAPSASAAQRAARTPHDFASVSSAQPATPLFSSRPKSPSKWLTSPLASAEPSAAPAAATPAPAAPILAPSPPSAAPAATMPTRISVRSWPSGQLLVDGQSKGPTPGRVDVAPGTHHIVVRLDDGRHQAISVTVAEGETKYVPINF